MGRFVNRPYEGCGMRDDVGIVPYEGCGMRAYGPRNDKAGAGERILTKD